MVHAPQTKPFPDSITYEHLKEFIIKDKYKITYTADKTIEEIKDLIKHNHLQFQEDNLKINEDASFKKIRQGKEDKSPLKKLQNKKTTTKPWQ